MLIKNISATFLAITLLSNSLLGNANSANTATSPEDLSFLATYKANIKGFAVNATRELKHVDQQHELSFRAKSWAGDVNEVSKFHLNNDTIQATQYQFSQVALGKKRERSLTFKHEEKTITSHYKGETLSIANSDNLALDKLNYQLQLQLDLRADKKNLAYKIADKGSLRHYRFEILDDETLTTKLGELNTTKVKVIRENKNKITYIWFAKDWDYLLVQLKQYEGDKQKLSIALNTAIVNKIAVTGITHNK